MSNLQQTAVINNLSHDGRGIITVDGKKVFIDGVLPGEEVSWNYTKRHRKYDEAKVEDIVLSSTSRVTAVCPNFLTCGGCSYQHMSTDSQLIYKQNIVKELLQHFGANVLPNKWLMPLQSQSATGYRTKARLGVKYVFKKEKLLIGFREKSTNYLTDMSSCSVLHQELDNLIKPLAELIANLSIYDQIAQIEFAMGDYNKDIINLSGRNIIVIIRNLADFNNQDYITLNNFVIKYNINLLIQPGNAESIYKFNLDKNIKDKNINDLFYSFNFAQDLINSDIKKITNIKYYFQPQDFTQVNLNLNNLMINQALDLLRLSGAEKVLDLFCGLGNFTLPIAKVLEQGRVVGVEGSDKMVSRAYKNAELNNLSNVSFYCADLYKTDQLTNNQNNIWLSEKYDCIVLDPPRSGAKELLQIIAKIGAEKILYISCDPATFARDVGILCSQYDYVFECAGIMDMFPHTKHVETMGLLIKK